MPFEITLRYSTPLNPVQDLDEVLTEFLRMVGYLPAVDDARSGEGPVRETVAYRLVHDCLLPDPARPWFGEELVAVLKTTKPTVYRHLNRLKSLDLLEAVNGHDESAGRKGYRLRYGSLARAWDFTEANAQNALRRYRETVNHLQRLLEEKPVTGPRARSPSREGRER
jgi:hypothetical protein